MLKKRSFWDTAVLHPVLFALYPLLALWMTNITQMPIYALSRAAIIVPIFLILGFGIGWLIYRNTIKVAIFTSLFMLFFLTYGHVFSLIDMKSVFGFMIGRHRFIFPIWIALLILGSILIGRIKGVPYSFNKILNLVSVFLVALTLIQITAFEIRSGGINTSVSTAGNARAITQDNAKNGASPDVYYILMDGYSREDVLRSMQGPDISGFLNELKGMGFYVARCSLDNYDHTTTSLTSSLNMNYLDELKIPIHPGEPKFKFDEFERFIKHSLVRQKFEQLGYQFITFKTVYDWLDITDSNYYVDLEKSAPFYNRLETVNFQYLFLFTTMLRPIEETNIAAPKVFEKLPFFILQLFFPKSSMIESREYRQYQQNLYNLQKLSEIPKLPGNKFIYAHLFDTHQPYVFNPDGSFRWPPLDDSNAYFAQIENINRVLPGILKNIIDHSKTPPIIILQSDHGYPYSPDRTGILNAYYLPGSGEKGLYPSITPVNSFRYIFNAYFGENNAMLPDKTFHSDHDWPYRFAPVAPNCPN